MLYLIEIPDFDTTPVEGDRVLLVDCPGGFPYPPTGTVVGVLRDGGLVLHDATEDHPQGAGPFGWGYSEIVCLAPAHIMRP